MERATTKNTMMGIAAILMIIIAIGAIIYINIRANTFYSQVETVLNEKDDEISRLVTEISHLKGELASTKEENIKLKFELDEKQVFVADANSIADVNMNTSNVDMSDIISSAIAINPIDETEVVISAEEEFKILQKYWYVFKESGRGNYINSSMNVPLLLHIDKMCEKHNINPHWMMGIYSCESWWNAKAYNPYGSYGLGQMLASTGREVYTKFCGYPAETWSADRLFDPFVNVELTTAYIGWCLAQSTDMIGALNFYSGGGGYAYSGAVASRMADLGITLTVANCHYE